MGSKLFLPDKQHYRTPVVSQVIVHLHVNCLGFHWTLPCFLLPTWVSFGSLLRCLFLVSDQETLARKLSLIQRTTHKKNKIECAEEAIKMLFTCYWGQHSYWYKDSGDQNAWHSGYKSYNALHAVVAPVYKCDRGFPKGFVLSWPATLHRTAPIMIKTKSIEYLVP